MRQTNAAPGRLQRVAHLQLKALGLEKGKSAATFDNIQLAVNRAAELLA